MIVARRLLLAAPFLLPACARAEPLPPGATRLDVHGDRAFIAVVVNGQATTAVVDSAAAASVVDRAFAAALGLRGGEAATAQGTGTATVAAHLVPGVTIDVAGLRLTPAAVAVIDLADLSRRLGERIDVILGRDLFDAARLALDLDRGILRVVPRAVLPRGVRLPLTRQRGIEAMPIRIEGHRALADIDLGNGGTVLVGAAFAARHRLLLGRDTGVIAGGGIGGGTLQTTFTLRSLDLAGVRLPAVAAAIDASPTAADANIGVRLLRRFGVVADFAARSVWLEWRG